MCSSDLMDSIVFLGGREASTLKDISENWLGKATISMQTEGRSRGQSESYSQNMQRLDRELMTTSEITTMPGDKCILQRSEEHTSELQSHHDLVCRLLLKKKNFFNDTATTEIYTLSLHDALPICGRIKEKITLSSLSGVLQASCQSSPSPCDREIGRASCRERV